MKRLVALVTVVLALGVVLAACGSDDDDPALQSSGDTSTTVAADDGHGDEGHDESSEVANGARRVEVTAASLSFDPDEVTVEAGEDVAIVLTSDDMLHDFTIDELDAHVAADRGETKEGGFTADEPGRYTYYCTVPGHRDAGMEGTLVVE